MKYVFWIAVVVAVVFVVWQILGPAITNVIFQEELKDSSAQLGWRTGVAPPHTDDELRSLVIRKAEQHDIVLDPRQVTVERGGYGDQVVVFLAADYKVKVDLLVYSFPLHFHPTSKGGGFWPSSESPPSAKPSAPAQKGNGLR